jgi:hypothetical protein
MKHDDKLYGVDDQEQLSDSVAEAVSELLNQDTERKDWPLKVKVFRRMKVLPIPACRLEETIVESTWELLEEGLGDPEGSTRKPTPRVLEAAAAFVKVMLEEYVPWACEPTGEVITVTKEAAREMCPEEFIP